MPATRDPKETIRNNIEISQRGCWLWKAYVNPNGYGQLTYKRKLWKAHRLSYVVFVGEIPEGKELDHLCRVRNCINPQHLEPVTRRTNALRGVGLVAENIRKESCPQGHPYDEQNTFTSKSGARECRTCRRARGREWYATHHKEMREAQRLYYERNRESVRAQQNESRRRQREFSRGDQKT